MKFVETLSTGLMEMSSNHPFWYLLTLTVLGWYSTVTIYVAVRGAYDIKHMLSTLAERDSGKPSKNDPGKSGS